MCCRHLEDEVDDQNVTVLMLTFLPQNTCSKVKHLYVVFASYQAELY